MFVLMSLLIDARVKAIVHLSADFRRAAAGVETREGRSSSSLAVIPSVCSKASLTDENCSPRDKSRGQVWLQLFVVLLSRKLEIRGELGKV